MTDFTGRDLNLPLDFIDNKKYSLRILSDGINAARHASDYTISNQTVRKGDAINIKMEKGGGWVGVLSPENQL